MYQYIDCEDMVVLLYLGQVIPECLHVMLHRRHPKWGFGKQCIFLAAKAKANQGIEITICNLQKLSFCKLDALIDFSQKALYPRSQTDPMVSCTAKYIRLGGNMRKANT